MSTDPSIMIALESLAFVALTAALGGGIATAIALAPPPFLRRSNRRRSPPRVRRSARPTGRISSTLAARVNLARIIL